MSMYYTLLFDWIQIIEAFVCNCCCHLVVSIIMIVCHFRIFFFNLNRCLFFISIAVALYSHSLSRILFPLVEQPEWSSFETFKYKITSYNSKRQHITAFVNFFVWVSIALMLDNCVFPILLFSILFIFIDINNDKVLCANDEYGIIVAELSEHFIVYEVVERITSNSKRFLDKTVNLVPY